MIAVVKNILTVFHDFTQHSSLVNSSTVQSHCTA